MILTAAMSGYRECQFQTQLELLDKSLAIEIKRLDNGFEWRTPPQEKFI